MEIIEAVGKHSSLIQAIGTIGLVAATIGLLYATVQMARSSKLLVKENKALREESKKPQVLTKLQFHSDHSIVVNLVISNVGRGVALNVKFWLDGDDEDMKQHGVITQGNQKPINYLSSGESEIYVLGSCNELFEEPLMNPLTAVVEFEDIDGRPYESRITLDVAQFEYVGRENLSAVWRGMSALEDIAKMLKQVNKHLPNFYTKNQ